MIHPDTELRFISDEIGYGVFATSFIPRGTIVYVRDALEVRVSEQDPLMNHAHYRQIVERYGYREADGVHIISWDIAKYVNHSCDSNSLSTGYGFEIAIRDIQPGEQLTDDYGMLNIEHDMPCLCGSDACRGMIRRNEFADQVMRWDKKVYAALLQVAHVSQPLFPYLEDETRIRLEHFMNDREQHPSVACLMLGEMEANASSI